ncbi:MAG: BlaI/MecI/CopY family transcriptional regulator [Bacteroides sp.]|nr:BlaI/MecI/CopY family transcriptional regulator [Bacteroides sp.]MCM1549140.1 BlaI/MecI/CopY family transcriptional regulator [Clostridium sp.]
MTREEHTPSESEWQIMEVLWDSAVPLTSSQVIQQLQEMTSMNPKMVRVLMNRLCQKGIISYTVDEKDARVYHYFPLKSREECSREKSRKFVESYFSGSHTDALAALLQSYQLTEEQIQELEDILEQSKRNEEK